VFLADHLPPVKGSGFLEPIQGVRFLETFTRFKKPDPLNDTYGVDVVDGEDDILVLASAVVVDMACHPDQKR